MIRSVLQSIIRSMLLERVNAPRRIRSVKSKLNPGLLVLIVTLFTAIAGSYTAEADTIGPTTNSIEPGTTITQQNWMRYRDFMSEGLAALFEGKHFWHLPPDLRLEIGPTTSIPLPKKYLEDTVRYSNRVSLLKTPFGGYVPAGYVAGLPFPRPLEGDPALRGQRIFWDSYYRYQPRVQGAPTFTYTVDRFGNMTQTSEVRTVFSQLAFLSEVDSPQTVTGAGDYYFVKYSQQVAPEQGKYSTILDMIPADPIKLDELYEFVPTLRRSLRLSQAARCAPVFGSDYLIDDEGDGLPGLPQLFEIQYIGEKRILALEHANPVSFNSPGGPSQPDAEYYHPGSVGFVPFPRPTLGRWELRPAYVLSLRRLPNYAKGYCYSRRVMYVDKENYFGGAQVDLYSPPGDLFKAQLIFLYPMPIPKTYDVAELLAGPNTGFLVDFINKHVTLSQGLRSCVNSDCAKNGYLDVNHYASPDALMKIVQ
jgi:hypothetical protein